MDHHSYPTRTRHKRRLSSELHTQPLPPEQYPLFPPPNVVLHPDDANSKVFLAVARAFVSVDNRAMTIKDIADRASLFGLVCQNLSAAAQAVTTYLRQHKTRCDDQDDHPLLLSHTLSGTHADDDLVPALFSRSGGDSNPLSDNRLTNFRKGTAVWYLSRATGVACPFARAGIRLCDYATTTTTTTITTTTTTTTTPATGDWKKEEPRMSSRRRKLLAIKHDRLNEEICGQKRKRPSRCSPSKRDRETSENDERPPKVKLTLRLKPLLIRPNSAATVEGSTATNPIDVPKDESDSYESDDDDSMPADSTSSSDDDDADEDEDESSQSQTAPSNKRRRERTEVEKEGEEAWSLPPYPRRSISIPCYTPSVQTSYYSTYDIPPSKYRDPFRRSPSVPFSIASPPPESEDEEDDFHVTMKKMKRIFEHDDEDDLGWEADLDSEGDGETMIESPGPRSPSAPFIVKEEPRDVQGMLDAWEGFDSNVVETGGDFLVAKEEETTVKVELPDPWSWDAPTNNTWQSEAAIGIKQEDFGIFDSILGPVPSTPLSPISSLSSQFSSFSWSDASSPLQIQDETTEYREETKYATIRPRSKTIPSPYSQSSISSSKSSSPFSPPPLTALAMRQSQSSASSSKSSTMPISSRKESSTALVSMLQSMTVNGAAALVSPPQVCVAPLQTRCVPSSSTTPSAEKVVVHTCQPCTPAITATHMEDIPVFQMMLGPFQLLRRIDSDFVNLSPIVAYSGTAGVASAADKTIASDNSKDTSIPTTSPCTIASLASTSPSSSSNLVTNATVITSGSPEICGTWVTLAAAQAYAREHLRTGTDNARALEVFLSDRLVDKFPSALQDFHKSNAGLRALNQFGKHFASTLMVAGGLGILDCAVKISGGGVANAGNGMSEDKVRASGTTFALVQSMDGDVPLTKTEQDLFHELCIIPPDWENKEGGPPSQEEDEDEASMAMNEDTVFVPHVAQIPGVQNLAMDVDTQVSMLPPTPSTAKPSCASFTAACPALPRRSGHTKRTSLSSMSSLSSDSDGMSPTASTVNISAPTAFVVDVTNPSTSGSSNQKEKDKANRPLRRSKRVADALAAINVPQVAAVQPSRSTRSRKGGSRNSLS